MATVGAHVGHGGFKDVVGCQGAVGCGKSGGCDQRSDLGCTLGRMGGDCSRMSYGVEKGLGTVVKEVDKVVVRKGVRWG
jgi:hypothetical protein